ncbi:MAG TPA: TetR/AcrR family transcriptional regulator [Actinomycetes bacterium]|nr:TetR/AcrR family transcriptional regulator [Actinomycetes bacterium]
MPDPTTPDEDRRVAILEAAVAVLVDRGYGSARVSDIAQRAGTSTGTIHYYFPTKVDVLDAALQYAYDRSSVRQRAELATLDDPRDRLMRLIDLQIPDGDVEAEWAVWLEFWNEARHRTELRERNAKVYRGWIEMIATIVQDGIRRGTFRGDVDADDFALRFTGMFDGLGIQVLLGPTLDRRWQLRQVMVGMVDRELSP